MNVFEYIPYNLSFIISLASRAVNEFLFASKAQLSLKGLSLHVGGHVSPPISRLICPLKGLLRLIVMELLIAETVKVGVVLFFGIGNVCRWASSLWFF